MGRVLTGGSSGVVLDGLTLTDELVFGALAGGTCHAALDEVSGGGGADLGCEAGRQASKLTLRKHLCDSFFSSSGAGII